MRILVGMSGGFDSTLAAKRLIDEGHTVEGATLVMHDYTDTAAAEAACLKLGIPLHVIDCKELFANIVIENFKNEYKNGRTPNPCVICNPKVKFFALHRFAVESGFDRIATGHYARIQRVEVEGREYPTVAKARDTKKDQSYMLYRLPSEILDVLVLPLSDDVKSELREEVRGTELESFDRPDSQEICFIPSGDYAGYIEASGMSMPTGSFVDTDGKVLGEHKGILRYTVGQRKGLGISLGERVFVRSIDPVSNEIVLGTTPSETKTARLTGVHTPYPIGDNTFRASVKIRYAAHTVDATVTIAKDTATVEFDTPVISLTPGQSAVFYDGDVVLGGGFIV